MNFQEVASDNVSIFDISTNQYKKECHPLPYCVYDMATAKYGENIVVLGGLSQENEVLNK
ncbi:---NA---, partial [Paramuricea clavata]